MEKQSKKRSRPPSPYPQETDGKKKAQEPKSKKQQASGLAAVIQENDRLKALHTHTVENERLKAEVSALTEANMEKVTEIESWKNKIANLQDQVATTDNELEVRKQSTTTLTNELQVTNQQLNEIHNSWQEQVTDFASKQSTVDSLQNQLHQVQEQFHRDTQNLIKERRRRKQLQERLEELRKAYESQGKAAQWHSIVRGGSAVAAIKKDCS